MYLYTFKNTVDKVPSFSFAVLLNIDQNLCINCMYHSPSLSPPHPPFSFFYFHVFCYFFSPSRIFHLRHKLLAVSQPFVWQRPALPTFLCSFATALCDNFFYSSVYFSFRFLVETVHGI